MTLHIIPDWHAYQRRLPEFNDTVHQVQLFLSQGQAVALVVVDYLPNLRQILFHGQIESAQIWSAYDVLQRVQLKYDSPIALMDIDWPDAAEFIEMSDRVVVRVAKKHYATVWLDQVTHARYDRIDLFEAGERVQELILDDRGFISCATTLDNHGQATRRDYLTPSGAVAVQEDCLTGAVTTQQSWTPQTTFKNMAELIAEVVAYHVHDLPDEDTLIIAQSQTAIFLVNKVAPKQAIILSYQTQRTVPQLEQELLLQISGTVDFAVVDTQQQFETINSQFDEQTAVAVIPPYATTALPVQTPAPITTVYWYAPEIDNEVFDAMRALMLAYPKWLLLIETTQDHRTFDDLILLDSQQAVNVHGLVDEHSQKAHQARYQFLSQQDEASRLRYLSNARLLMDLTPAPEQFLQTAAISHEVPQINRIETPYVKPNQNGQIIHKSDQLQEILVSYLTGRYNQQAVRETSQAIGANYQDDMLWIKWQQVFNQIKQRKASGK